MLARVARLAAAITGAPWAIVAFRNATTLTVAAAHGLGAALTAGGTEALDEVVCALPLASGVPFACANVLAKPDLAARTAVGRVGVQSYLGVPFRDPQGRLVGTLCAMSPQPRSWTSHDVEQLTDLAVLVEGELVLRREVAERRRARSAQARFRALVEHTSELIVLLDAGGRATYVSPAFNRVLGHTPDPLLGWGVLRLVHPDDKAITRDAMAELLREPGGRRELRVRARHGAGGWRTVDVVAENLAGDPAVGSVVVNARDVTHQVTLETQLKQVQKLEALGRLAGGVAHDFNNLLTVIGTSARFVRDAVHDALPPALAGEAREDLDEIDRAVERAGALTRQLLTFSHARHAEPRPTRVADVVRGVEKMARRVVGDDVEVVSLADAEAGEVLADPGQLEQALLNLVVNARDAMPGGGVLVLETRRANLAGAEAARAGVAPGAWAVIDVSDTGIGMDAATQARIFEPFFTTKPVGQGTGLGLATVYGIVTQAGGHVSVQSCPGRGTTFSILLPRQATSTPEGEAAVEDAAQAAPCARVGETVLVVEDEAAVRHVARRVLERVGYRVLDARHGAEGLRVWQAHGGDAGGVHLVLTDLTMPELGGQELIDQLHARRPAQAVAVMTGYASSEPLGWADSQGLPVVDKPFHAATLARTVRAAIDGAERGGAACLVAWAS